MLPEQFHTLSAEAEFLYKDRGSRFFAFAFPAQDAEHVRTQLKKLRELYPDASHHCYAYILADPTNGSGFGDDGEPANSAGRPILRELISRRLRFCHVVVVRYFGGNKLGVPGLIDAYGKAAAGAIEKAGITIYIPSETWQICTAYSNENTAYRLIRQFGGTMLGRSIGSECCITFRIAADKLENLKERCSEIPNFEMIQVS